MAMADISYLWRKCISIADAHAYGGLACLWRMFIHASELSSQSYDQR